MSLSRLFDPLRAAWGRYRQRGLQVREWSALAESLACTGKSLAIVGNAGYLRDLDLGDQIDGCDLVLRMNNFATVGFERQVGRRTDLFLTTFHHDVALDRPELRRVSHLVSATPNNFTKPSGAGFRYRHGECITRGLRRLGRREVFAPALGRFADYHAALGRYPTAGGMAISLALDCLLPPLGRLLIAGFSFFQGPAHYFSQQAVQPVNHDLRAERSWLRERLAPALAAGLVALDPVMAEHLRRGE